MHTSTAAAPGEVVARKLGNTELSELIEGTEDLYLADAGHPLPDGQVLGVDGLAVVDAPLQDVAPAAIQLRQRQPQLCSRGTIMIIFIHP